MQAIQTKYLNPTNTRGPRVRATCSSGTAMMGWDHGTDDAGNHAAAARKLQELMARTGGAQWLKPMVGGCLPDGSYAHVFKD